MKQISFVASGFEIVAKRKREFLDEMNLVVPWAELVALTRQREHQAGAISAQSWVPISMTQPFSQMSHLELEFPGYVHHASCKDQ